MAKLRALLARHGVPLEYAVDRAAIDTGLHLFAEGPTGLDTSQVRVWFQAKGKHASTFSADKFHAGGTIAEQVQVNHLRFWYAAPACSLTSTAVTWAFRVPSASVPGVSGCVSTAFA